MKAVIRAVQMQIILLVIGALVIIMAEFVVDGNEIARVNLDAHFNPEIIFLIHVPRRCVADDFAVFWFQEL